MYYPANGPESLTLNEIVALNLTRLGLSKSQLFNQTLFKQQHISQVLSNLKIRNLNPSKVKKILQELTTMKDSEKSSIEIINMDCLLAGFTTWTFGEIAFNKLIHQQNLSIEQINDLNQASNYIVNVCFSTKSQLIKY